MQPIVTKSIDMGEGQKLLVEDLSPEIQHMVSLFDVWKNEQRDVQLSAHKVGLALEGLQAQISGEIQKFMAPEEDKVEGAVEDAVVAE